ncbi:MAG: AAA family ATPase [Candidatus Helarchaeota archaeon]
MYLKKLIISNFKTFNGSRELYFSKGYTVLSGPNGSGKSNTLDAILFVLGRHDERVKKTVAEVISKDFNTNNLLADFTEVRLIFSKGITADGDNQTQELIVSRQLRVPASGKAYSIYKINGKETSLSEIHKMLPLMDYNIVKQGEITSRMYETPESRRYLIEKVAGLAQLDPLISESLAKIMNSKATLKRIGIFLKDAKKRLQELEKERERALNYRDLENKLKKFKALKIYSTKFELITKLEKLEDLIKDQNERINETQKKIDNRKTEIKQFMNRIEELERQKQEFKRKKTEVSVHYERDFSSVEQINERLNEIKILIESLEDRIRALKIEIEKLTNERRKILNKIKKTTEKQNNILNEIKELQYQNKNLELSLPRLREEAKELDLKRSSLITQVSENEKDIRKIDSEIRELRQKRITLEEKLQEYEELKQDQISNLGKATRELRRIEGEINLNKTKTEKIRQEIVLNRQLLEKQRLGIHEFAAKEVEIEKNIIHFKRLLEEAKPNYSRAVQKVLEGREKGEINGVLGTIIELIEDINPEYAIAIEAVGGIKLQNIVTKTFDQTKKVIEYVKKFRVGKITFYPLDILDEWQLKSTPYDPKVIGKIIDLVRFDRSKYQKVMANVFKNTILVQDLDTARKYRSYRAVTLDGDVVEPGGWVTTRGKFEPRFLLIKEFYRKKITELETDLEKARQLSKRLKAEEAKLEQQNNTKKQKLEGLVNRNNFLRGRTTELQDRIKDLEKGVNKWQNELESIEGDLVKTKAEEQNAHIELSKKFEIKEAFNRQKDELEELIAKTELGKTEQQIDKNRREIQKLREDNREFEKERDVFKTQINQIESNTKIKSTRIGDLTNRIENELLIERQNALQEKEEIMDKIEAENLQIETILDKINEIETLQKDLRAGKQQLVEMIEKFELEIEKMNKNIADELQTKKIRIELQIQELEHQIQELGVEITEDFEINLDQINQKIEALELEMSSMGLIDYQAPEKYLEEKSRLDDLISKKEIYEKELEEALKTKDDLLNQKKLKFLNTISEINRYLEEIFIKLYGKGRASLILINEKEPLESGIDIKVDVGSGTVDYIGTLSGGEKSMVALAFIFAIQRYHPAPIYFLDEIDSYLDDSHCEALGLLLKELSENSQYIVITPRLNSLSTYADRIYGVWLENGTTEIVCQKADDFMILESV